MLGAVVRTETNAFYVDYSYGAVLVAFARGEALHFSYYGPLLAFL